MPFGFHLAMDTLPSRDCKWWLQVRLGCIRLSLRARLDFSIPSTSPASEAVNPAFGYGAPHPSAGGTSTLLNNALLSAHHSSIRGSWPMAISLTTADRRKSDQPRVFSFAHATFRMRNVATKTATGRVGNDF